MHVNQVLIIFVKKKDIVVLKSKALNNSLNEKKMREQVLLKSDLIICSKLGQDILTAREREVNVGTSKKQTKLCQNIKDHLNSLW